MRPNGCRTLGIEELQHGLALRRYVEHVWPEFDWERGYQRFFDEYSKTCSIDNFELRRPWKWPPAAWWKPAPPPTTAPGTGQRRAGAARSDRRIANDEVRHYKHFFRYFNNR
jgi:hypothetical protein